MIICAIKNHWTMWDLSTTRGRNERRCHGEEEQSSSQENRAEKTSRRGRNRGEREQRR
jgi:hypothetical protein